MIKIKITENQGGQRLDRFLKKYFDRAPLSMIYRLIRKDIKVNGKREKEDFLLSEGDEIFVYMLDSEAAKLQKSKLRVRAKRQFGIAYEDDNLLAATKPYGLLTHGDSKEKKNHLANQVIDYLIEKGEYNPRFEKTFTPSPVNRLDRNTTGLVLFAKNAEALRELSRMIRERDSIKKFYLAIAVGKIPGRLVLRDMMVKDSERNIVHASDIPETGIDTSASKKELNNIGACGADVSDAGKLMETVAVPLRYGKIGNKTYTLLDVEIITGRTHQIRVQLAKAGYPLLGDVKYGKSGLGQTTQLLHSHRIEFTEIEDGLLKYMEGKKIEAEAPDNFKALIDKIF